MSVSKLSSSLNELTRYFVFTVPPKNSNPSSAAQYDSTYSTVVPRPTAPSDSPLISLFGANTAPPCRIETYRNTPELSLSSVPPYRNTFSPFNTMSVNPSYTSYFGVAAFPPLSTALLITQFPNSTSPPHNPRAVGPQIGMSSGNVVSSASAVKMIGFCGVPSA